MGIIFHFPEEREKFYREVAENTRTLTDNQNKMNRHKINNAKTGKLYKTDSKHDNSHFHSLSPHISLLIYRFAYLCAMVDHHRQWKNFRTHISYQPHTVKADAGYSDRPRQGRVWMIRNSDNCINR